METLAGNYDVKILIAENTARLVQDEFILRRLDLVDAQGYVEPIGVYELFAETATPLPDEQTNALRLFREGFEAYQRQQWETAADAFTKAMALRDGDGPSRVMVERCRIYQNEPPGEDWDGVFRHD